MALDTGIKLIILDFDGVLTDNFIYIDNNGNESVRCCKSDSIALSILKENNIAILVLTGEKSPHIKHRCNKLGLILRTAIRDKSSYLEEILDSYHLDVNEVMFIGNDLNDLYLMRKCIHTACPVDSHESILREAKHILTTSGGYGVIRELLTIL